MAAPWLRPCPCAGTSGPGRPPWRCWPPPPCWPAGGGREGSTFRRLSGTRPHPEVPERSGGLEGALPPAARSLEPSFEARCAVTSG
ncbi:MAG: hypothetical protein CMH16_00330 [Methylobacterium sp.]|nr:hypothetical protein [Methylobacterium sp.]